MKQSSAGKKMRNKGTEDGEGWQGRETKQYLQGNTKTLRLFAPTCIFIEQQEC